MTRRDSSGDGLEQLMRERTAQKQPRPRVADQIERVEKSKPRDGVLVPEGTIAELRDTLQAARTAIDELDHYAPRAPLHTKSKAKLALSSIAAALQKLPRAKP